LEHFAAFGVVGLPFGIAYPKRWLWVVAIVLGSAFALESTVMDAFLMSRSKPGAASAGFG
jgi:hypothetical protein